ncbi:hypothetical protein NDU88_000178 [Pleurodeles waltl]|uniref:Uncharacterized protein n=1 Tax=Pleurodeles waltl TaxID=8319 RepID=A0AAV7S8W1_PLEWA|nr:hypothetical protein NDU88_000178 [Pleurodeles waltl]
MLDARCSDILGGGDTTSFQLKMIYPLRRRLRREIRFMTEAVDRSALGLHGSCVLQSKRLLDVPLLGNRCKNTSKESKPSHASSIFQVPVVELLKGRSALMRLRANLFR